MQLQSGENIIARISRGDTSDPNYFWTPLNKVVTATRFLAGLNESLLSEPRIRSSHLLYSRSPTITSEPTDRGGANHGRNLLVFKKEDGETGLDGVWSRLNASQRVSPSSIFSRCHFMNQ